MVIKTNATQQIAVIFCKDFPELVRRVQCQEPLFPEAFLSFVRGFVNWTGSMGMTMMPAESEQFIATKVANGYTVTAYVRLPDLHAYVPFTGKAEMSAAAAANQKILGMPRTETQSNRVVLS
jgi:hypothetical protein